jgi:hypothetical protein
VEGRIGQDRRYALRRPIEVVLNVEAHGRILA